VARTAADHQADLALERPARPDEARGTLDALHVLRVRRGEAFEHVGLELGGVVEEIRHTSLQGTRRRDCDGLPSIELDRRDFSLSLPIPA